MVDDLTEESLSDLAERSWKSKHGGWSKRRKLIPKQKVSESRNISGVWSVADGLNEESLNSSESAQDSWKSKNGSDESLSDSAESSETREENYNSNGEESSSSQDSWKRVFASLSLPIGRRCDIRKPSVVLLQVSRERVHKKETKIDNNGEIERLSGLIFPLNKPKRLSKNWEKHS